jgi:glycosyltransferase involved in cell wall biosynthesis
LTRVSVVIPTFNAGPEFEELLKRISMQEGDFDVETLVVDSGSTDGTVELARRYGAIVHRIPQTEFNHGATRNLGISRARGEYVALTVQDAVPLDGRWLSAMVENLERDERVAGVYSRQIPREESSALTRVLINDLATASLERREQSAKSPEHYRKMPPRKRRRLAVFDDVSSCLRRAVWEELPYEKTDFGEDIRWGKRVLEAGYKIVYEPRSAVFHSHERGAMYDLKRYYMDQRVLLELFELKLVSNLALLLLAIFRSSAHLYQLLRQDKELTVRGVPRLVWLAVKYAVPAQVGNYLAVKSGAIARLSPRAFGKLHRFLSSGI